jgi:hypothetical protein
VYIDTHNREQQPGEEKEVANPPAPAPALFMFHLSFFTLANLFLEDVLLDESQ